MSSRIAFVTGASRGIGRAAALSLASAGHTVILAARDQQKLDETAQAIRQAGGIAHTVQIDLSSPDSIQQAFAKAKEIGTVSILVNNAGITRDGLAMRMKPEDWAAVLNTNLTGAFLCIQQVLQGMMKERWGRIINIASVVGESGNAGQANYVASKAGLVGLTKSLAIELGSRNITVNAITPGFIETDMTAVLGEPVREKMLAAIPLKRFGQPEEVASAVKFLAGDEAAYITGSVLRVNGGMYL
ncbi:MAG: 3-oxoacyl-[acyl-carrier-protein] reductase [Acidobacteria bacterium]|nr:3-oxoacyl-[acyl-carrier-protein] reductase [Acidobacteriota bacterium]